MSVTNSIVNSTGNNVADKDRTGNITETVEVSGNKGETNLPIISKKSKTKKMFSYTDIHEKIKDQSDNK